MILYSWYMKSARETGTKQSKVEHKAPSASAKSSAAAEARVTRVTVGGFTVFSSPSRPAHRTKAEIKRAVTAVR